MARERLPGPSPDPSSVVDCELYEACNGSRDMAVEGRPPLKESGDEERMSEEGIVRVPVRESRERREKMVLRVSKRGRMTVSR